MKTNIRFAAVLCDNPACQGWHPEIIFTNAPFAPKGQDLIMRADFSLPTPEMARQVCIRMYEMLTSSEAVDNAEFYDVPVGDA